MGIFGELFGGSEKNAEFKADQPENAAETPITPENKQEILPEAATYTAETGKMVANVEEVEEAPAAYKELEEIVKEVEALPKQN